MNCPKCGGVLGCVNTYQSDPIRRRRVCKSCGYVAYTLEVFEEGLINGGSKEEAVKQDGQEEKRSLKEANA